MGPERPIEPAPTWVVVLVTVFGWTDLLFCGTMLPFLVPVWGVLAWHGKRRMLAASVAASPHPWMLAAGIVFGFRAYPHAGAPNGGNIDPTSRVYGGVVTDIPAPPSLLGMEIVAQAVVRRLAAVWGPPPGAYLGPLPTAEEARAALRERGEPVQLTATPGAVGRLVAASGQSLEVAVGLVEHEVRCSGLGSGRIAWAEEWAAVESCRDAVRHVTIFAVATGAPLTHYRGAPEGCGSEPATGVGWLDFGCPVAAEDGRE